MKLENKKISVAPLLVGLILFGLITVFFLDSNKGTSTMAANTIFIPEVPVELNLKESDNSEIPEKQAVLIRAVQQALVQRSMSDYAGWSAYELIEGLQSGAGDLKERQKMLWALCLFDDPSVQHFLSEFLLNNSENEYLRASILDGLATADKQWVYELSFDLLGSDSVVVARKAVRILGQLGGSNAVNALSQLARDYQVDSTISLVAAEALGEIGTPEAGRALVALFELGISTGEDAAVEHALAGLGQLGSSETQDYLKEVYTLTTDPKVRVLVLESLEESKGTIAAITRLALMDDDEEVRAAAAYSLAYADKPNLTEAELLGFLETESEPSVRTYLYQAMESQQSIDMDRIIPLIVNEIDPNVQLVACQLACRELMHSSDQKSYEYTDELTRKLYGLIGNKKLNKNELEIVQRLIERIEKK